MSKKCSKCKKEKPPCEFYKDKKFEDNFTKQCKACFKEYRDKNREKNRLYMENLRKNNNEKVKETRRKSWRNLDPRDKLIQQSRSRAKRKNLNFNLKKEDLKIPILCPLLEIPFIVGTKNDYEQTYSLDRIDPNKGYIKDNVWVITKKANSMKNSATKDELITFAINILKHFGDDDIVQTIQKCIESKDKEP